MTSSLAKVNRSSGVHFQTFFSTTVLFLMFLNIQIDLTILQTDDEQFTLTTKNHCISPLRGQPLPRQQISWLAVTCRSNTLANETTMANVT